MVATPQDVATGYWEAATMTVQCLADREVITCTYEGFEESLSAFAAQFQIGSKFANEIDADGNIVHTGGLQDFSVVTANVMKRGNGGVWQATIQFATLYEISFWNIDFAEVSKDIKTWLVEQYTHDGYVHPKVWDELAKVAQWEHQREVEAWVTWQNFQYNSEGDTLEGMTRTLAEKIMKGVQTYSIYAPVITVTTIYVTKPELWETGTIGTRCNPQGFPGFEGEDYVDWCDKANDWLKVGQKSNSNSDGTFTLVEQWQGADEVDPDLYPES